MKSPVGNTGAPPDLGKEVFRLLVGDERNNIVGYVAYGLYRRSKQEWSNKIVSDAGRRPNANELGAFEAAITETTLHAFENEARSVLAEYAASAVEDATSEIVARATPGIVARAIKGSFWRGVWQAVLGGFIFAAITRSSWPCRTRGHSEFKLRHYRLRGSVSV